MNSKDYLIYLNNLKTTHKTKMENCNHLNGFFNKILAFFGGEKICEKCKEKYNKKIKFIQPLITILNFTSNLNNLSIQFTDKTNDKLMINKNIYRIFIKTDKDFEFQLYAFIHEFGHYIIENKRIKPNINEAIEFCRQQNKKIDEPKKMKLIADEITAWNVGKEIAEKLDLKIKKKNFNEFKNLSVISYI